MQFSVQKWLKSGGEFWLLIHVMTTLNEIFDAISQYAGKNLMAEHYFEPALVHIFTHITYSILYTLQSTGV